MALTPRRGNLGLLASINAAMEQITLLGKTYRVRCPEGQEQALQRAARQLNKLLQHSQANSGLSSREDIIMMTALNLCHEQLQHNAKDGRR